MKFLRLIGAILLILLVLATCSPPGNIHYDRGRLLQNEGNYEDALREYQEALKSYPDSPLVYYNMGLCYGELKRYGEGVSAMEKALYLMNDPKIRGDFSKEKWTADFKIKFYRQQMSKQSR